VTPLEDVRTDLHAALVEQLGAVGLPADAIHAFVPDELATPTAWIVSPFGIRPQDPRTVVAEVSVIVVVDGAEPAQLANLDSLEAAAWVALEQVGTATLAAATALAGGGSTLHAVTLSGDVDVDVRTLCPPALELAELPRSVRR